MNRNHRIAVSLSAVALLLADGVGSPALAAEPGPTQTVGFPKDYLEEGPLPAGYPPPSEVGQVVEKLYPKTRSYSATGDGAFFKCFAYLSAKQHKMTAPVVMEYRSTDVDRTDADQENVGERGADGIPVAVERMHFLLERNSLDEPSDADPVRVGDIPAMRVLSIAYQGELTEEVVESAQSKLSARLAELPKLHRAGEFRILGYNSPMIAKDKTYWEVQLPVE